MGHGAPNRLLRLPCVPSLKSSLGAQYDRHRAVVLHRVALLADLLDAHPGVDHASAPIYVATLALSPLGGGLAFGHGETRRAALLEASHLANLLISLVSSLDM